MIVARRKTAFRERKVLCPGGGDTGGVWSIRAGAAVALSVVAALFIVFPASASTPAGAEELAAYGAWSVFRYPRDPWQRCYIGNAPTMSQGAARVIVDVGAGDIRIVRNAGHAYRQRGDTVPEGTITVGTRSFPYLHEPFASFAEEADELSDDRMIEVMKASEADAAGAEMRVRGESWRNVQVTDAFSLRGFTAAHEAASGRICGPRPPPAGTRSAVDLRSVNVEGAQGQIGVGHTAVRLLGPIFRKGEREMLVIRAMPRDRHDWYGGYRFTNARLDFFMSDALIGRASFHYHTKVAEVCVSPQSGRLEIVVTSSTGGSGSWVDSYVLFYDPPTGRVAIVERGSHGEEIHREFPGLEDGRFVPPWCAFRRHMSSVESFAREIMAESFFVRHDEITGDIDELGRIETSEMYGRAPSLSGGRYAGFTNDIFSAYLDLILQYGPDSPLQFERFDSSEFSVVAMKHSGYSFRDAFQMIFAKATADDLWTPIYHAGPDNSLGRYKLAEVSGFVDDETLRLYMCRSECGPWEWGRYANVDFNLRTFEEVVGDDSE